ncbi:hypothetical protein JCM10212_000066 [Sporobolomyces blumeae]
MRESNFTFAAHNRAAVCISSTLYDRRALDAPAASLPLVNSLTHLSYLTATSARIRESLSSDGGLERLVRILQNCANPSAVPASLADVKGKGPLVPKRAARKSPFKAFAEYDLLPSLEELRDLEVADVEGALLALLPDGSQSGYSYSIPPSLLLPPSLKARHLLYTYTLAFQCVVNIGVRGSEAIRTRVVEAGALEVVIHVLERYLEEIERKRLRNQLEWQRAEQARLAQLQLAEVQAMTEGRRDEEHAHRVPAAVPVASTSTSPVVSAPTPTRPRLTRINIVAASSATADLLAPPSRVQTPDTVVSTDDASLTGDDNGSASGQETEEIVMSTSTSTTEDEATPTSTEARVGLKAEGSRSASSDQGTRSASIVPESTDENGDVVMGGTSQSADGRDEVNGTTPASDETAAQRLPTPRAPQPRLPPNAAHRTPRTAHPHALHLGQVPVPPPAAPALEATPEPEGQLYFRDEDVLLALQLLAYLSKYPHVREVFHSPSPSSSEGCDSDLDAADPSSSCSHGSFGAHPLIRPHSINIFSLVELFTHRPPSDDPFTPRLSSEVQYWACTIMRNACRKDEQRGGIRQCANMNCGKWEAYAREFAKCRRCRRAKYCSKACQSASWGNGHKFWCHKQSSDERSSRRRPTETDPAVDPASASTTGGAVTHPPSAHDGRRRRQRRTNGGGDDEDEDDEDDLPPPPALPSLAGHGRTEATPHREGQGPTGRHRSGTISMTPPDPSTVPARHQAHPHPHHPHHPHPHALVQPTALPGLEAVAGQIDPGAVPGLPLGIDEDRVAREMMLMGEEEGVRVQDA